MVKIEKLDLNAPLSVFSKDTTTKCQFRNKVANGPTPALLEPYLKGGGGGGGKSSNQFFFLPTAHFVWPGKQPEFS